MKEEDIKKVDSLIQLVYADGKHMLPYSEFYSNAGQNFENILLIEGLIEIFPHPGDIDTTHLVRLTPTGNHVRIMQGGFSAYLEQKRTALKAQDKIVHDTEKALKQNAFLIILLILTFFVALAALYFSTYHYTNLHNF